MRIGVISDTHGLLRAQALEFLQGSQMIIHCGDVCDPGVIRELSRLAPVRAVRGNNDHGEWAKELPEWEIIQIEDISIYVIHDRALMDIDPLAAGVSVVLSGHSHKPEVAYRDGVLYLNPGSAGPRRFKLPISVAELIVEPGTAIPRIVELANDALKGRD